jgi:hypothetical protein
MSARRVEAPGKRDRPNPQKPMTPGENLGKAVEFLSLAQIYAEDGAIASAIELTKGALEWLQLVRQQREAAGLMRLAKP